jgi:glycosyltransferase involved in cell wall biosynthesis
MITPSLLREALASRVEKYFGEFFDYATSPDLSENFLAIVSDLRANPKPEKNWLALTFLLGQLPTVEQVTKLEMWIRSSRDDQELVENILRELTISLARSGALTDVLVIKERVIVLLKDVAKQSLHTGVQRVTRDLCRQLIDIDQTIVFANISDDGHSISPIDIDFARVMFTEKYRLNNSFDNQDIGEKFLIPINCRILVPEIPLNIDFNSRLSALGKSSSNSFSCIGYDLIPILSPEFVSREESEQFTHYLSMTSEAKKVMCISDQAAAEFAGYYEARKSVEGNSPEISVIDIPTSRTLGSVNRLGRSSKDSKFHILSVGTIEPRKAQIETLLACKELWSEGADLKITFVGRVHAEILDIWNALTHGLADSMFRHLIDISDEDLAHLYSSSDLSIFVSKHEGYGLPIVESILHGTPVLTTNFSPSWSKVKDSGAIGISTVDASTISGELRKIIKRFAENKEIVHVDQDLKLPNEFEYASYIYREIIEL